jgi:hypothetical protein
MIPQRLVESIVAQPRPDPAGNRPRHPQHRHRDRRRRSGQSTRRRQAASLPPTAPTVIAPPRPAPCKIASSRGSACARSSSLRRSSITLKICASVRLDLLVVRLRQDPRGKRLLDTLGKSLRRRLIKDNLSALRRHQPRPPIQHRLRLARHRSHRSAGGRRHHAIEPLLRSRSRVHHEGTGKLKRRAH